MELFIFQDLTFSYPGQTHAALDGLRFEIPAGQFLVIAGPSGCGKSTLLRQFKSALTPVSYTHLSTCTLLRKSGAMYRFFLF